jgi:hypothetical protein
MITQIVADRDEEANTVGLEETGINVEFDKEELGGFIID